MTTENLALMRAIGAKMDFLNQRQKLISQNIANADTPNYKPQDLVEVDFGTVLEKVTKTNRVGVDMTDGKHFGGGGDVRDPKARVTKDTYEVAPVGNAVVMEEQLIKSNQTVMEYNLMTNLYYKQAGMLRTAIGYGR